MSVTPRMTLEDFYKIAPDARDALIALGKAVDASGLEKELTELVKLRVSQINGCAFCLQLHLGIARKLGIKASKLDLAAAWRDADIYTPRERAALAWAEILTQAEHGAASDAAFDSLRQEFNQSDIAFLTAAIANINAWNRICGGLRFAPVI
ncbi:carboxymuconolactone decarboxylase family protein [Dongia rigui]|uniref:Carboxymuconolactone decarboxylase family protein n=1 Tax=Dongia rigui TaxID=940149 RepID=A0ABU5DYR2_9PROT|nr:carboxymuconolactone decarboxylase family protein [Dongia rigui]MDY0872415.1 carboxymuconolactone decarboxylase family protein [Dongia rigui]